MYIILLSGGSGKRLWPLSNTLRPKQYVKLLKDVKGESISMLQRVWEQLATVELQHNTIICASREQEEIISSQVPGAKIAVEPAQRDTFPAVVLSCLYLKDKIHASVDDMVCVLPVDLFVDNIFFETLKTLPQALKDSNANIMLIGAQPIEPSSKYGYIIPAEDYGTYSMVGSFHEKPAETIARQLIEKGALWNCGVFCFRLREILQRLDRYEVPIDYHGLCVKYDLLPKTSFDYEVAEKANRLAVVELQGKWNDLGTWDAFANEIRDAAIGNGTVDASCVNTQIVNELDIPVLAVGVKDLIVVASYDGVLVADKAHTGDMKNVIATISQPPMYEEWRWGTVKILDYWQDKTGKFSSTRKIRILKNQKLKEHSHIGFDESLTILNGHVQYDVSGARGELLTGDSIHIKRGMKHTLLAITDLTLLEVQVGEKREM